MIRINSAENYYILRFLDKYLEGHKGFIAGGCFKNIFNHEEIKDLDIFFHNEEDFNNAVKYFESKTTTRGWDDSECEYVLYYENDKVKCFKNTETGVRLDICNSVFGTPKEVISKFDFTITKFAYYHEEDHQMISYHEDFFEHLHLKRLVTDDMILYPMSTFEKND